MFLHVSFFVVDRSSEVHVTLQEAAEMFVTETFHKADMARLHAGRETVNVKDIRFSRFMTPESLWVVPVEKVWEGDTFGGQAAKPRPAKQEKPAKQQDKPMKQEKPAKKAAAPAEAEEDGEVAAEQEEEEDAQE